MRVFDTRVKSSSGLGPCVTRVKYLRPLPTIARTAEGLKVVHIARSSLTEGVDMINAEVFPTATSGAGVAVLSENG